MSVGFFSVSSTSTAATRKREVKTKEERRARPFFFFSFLFVGVAFDGASGGVLFWSDAGVVSVAVAVDEFPKWNADVDAGVGFDLAPEILCVSDLSLSLSLRCCCCFLRFLAAFPRLEPDFVPCGGYFWPFFSSLWSVVALQLGMALCFDWKWTWTHWPVGSSGTGFRSMKGYFCLFFCGFFSAVAGTGTVTKSVEFTAFFRLADSLWPDDIDLLTGCVVFFFFFFFPGMRSSDWNSMDHGVDSESEFHSLAKKSIVILFLFKGLSLFICLSVVLSFVSAYKKKKEKDIVFFPTDSLNRWWCVRFFWLVSVFSLKLCCRFGKGRGLRKPRPFRSVDDPTVFLFRFVVVVVFFVTSFFLDRFCSFFLVFLLGPIGSPGLRLALVSHVRLLSSLSLAAVGRRSWRRFRTVDTRTASLPRASRRSRRRRRPRSARWPWWPMATQRRRRKRPRPCPHARSGKQLPTASASSVLRCSRWEKLGLAP